MEYKDNHKLKRIFYNIKDSIHFVYILLALILLIATFKFSEDKSTENTHQYDFAYIIGIDGKEDYEYLRIPHYEDTVRIMSFIPKFEGIDEYSYPIPFAVINNNVKNDTDLIFEIKAEKNIFYNNSGDPMVVSRISDVEELFTDSLFTKSITQISNNVLHNNSHITLGNTFLYTDPNKYYNDNKYNTVGLNCVDSYICTISDTLNFFNLTIKNDLYFYYDKNDLENNIKSLMKKIDVTTNSRNPLYLYEYSKLYETNVEDFLYKSNYKKVLNCKLDSIYSYDIEQKKLYASRYYNFNSMQTTNTIAKIIRPYLYVCIVIFFILFSLRFVLIIIYKNKHRKESLSGIYNKFFDDFSFRTYVILYFVIIIVAPLVYLFIIYYY